MPIELRVEFAGLCLYMIDPLSDGLANRVGIVMPDARKTTYPIHVDGSKGDPHVGYARFDLASLNMGDTWLADPGDVGVKDDIDRPRNEIIHRFDGEELDFGLNNKSTSVGHKLAIPSFDRFADSLTKIDNLFKPNPPDGLLMRTILNGGRISADGTGKTWGFSSVLKDKPNGDDYTSQFAGFSVWTCPLEEPNLTVTIRKFDGRETAKIPLKAVPVRDKNGNVVKDKNDNVLERITIKIANLCAHNPMEWLDFRPRTVVDRDIDFKWLYRLLQPKNGRYDALLKGAELPFPREVSVQAFGDEDCMGGSITTPIP